MMLALTITQVVLSVVLVVAVLMQHGKQQGLSGAIAGGAETFFGKNKGKTIDAVLKKVTAVVAILFVVSSLTLAAVSINDYKKQNAGAEAGAYTVDENGNIVDQEGNVISTVDEAIAAEEPAEEATDAATEDTAVVEDAATEEVAADETAENAEEAEATTEAAE